MDLSPLEIYIILHLKRANVEYAKMIMKLTKVNLDRIENAIESLERKELVERDSGSSIKRTRAKFKKAKEVHKHHSYYHLSKEGSLLARKIDDRFLEDYFDSILGPSAFKFIKSLLSENFEEACKHMDVDCDEFREFLIRENFITPSGNRTKFLRLFLSFI